MRGAVRWMAEDHVAANLLMLVLVVGGAPAREAELDAAALQTLEVLLEELPPKQAARLAARRHGLKARELYQAALARREVRPE